MVKRFLDRSTSRPEAFIHQEHSDRVVARSRPTCPGSTADRYVYEALKAGAAGFLLKATPPDRLVAGIETVAAGEALLAPALTRRLIEEHLRRPAPYDGVPDEIAVLTDHEGQVLVLMARGFSNDEIAEELFVAPATVKTHVNRVLAKLGVASRVQAVVLAYESGLVTPATPPAGR